MNVALIMDGNGRWATVRGLPRQAGHAAGVHRIEPIVRAAAERGVGSLTLYAFSSDNWKRPAVEVQALMRLFARHLRAQAPRMREAGVRIQVIGRRDRLPVEVSRAIEVAESMTRASGRMTLRVAVDYSARDALARAAFLHALSARPESPSDSFATALGRAYGGSEPAQGLDLLIRTGGERRLSDFMLYEAAYAELVFLDVLWPDFSPADFHHAIDTFAIRQRRFGGLPSTSQTVREDAALTR
ncbi:MAG: polyprenyl diphosphate synthase [Bacteroidota bacterium]